MPMDEAEGSVLTGTPDAAQGSWTDGFEDTVRDHMATKGYTEPAHLASAYMNLEKAVGADKVVLPHADSDISEWEGWAKLGTPADADGYELVAPEGFESYDQGLSDWFREAAYEAKLPASMAQGLHDHFVERMMDSHSEQANLQAQQNQDWESELRKEYGTAFDERIGAAQKAMREYGTPELQDAIDAAGLGSNPDLVRAFANIGIKLGKGPQFKDGDTSGQFGTTPAMALEQIAALRSNPALSNKQDPEYKVLNDKLTRLNELAYGTDVLFHTR
jgi:hypothetical protein